MYFVFRPGRRGILVFALVFCAFMAALGAAWPRGALPACEGEVFTVSTLPREESPATHTFVCLTFDDGPTSLTESVLDTLARLDVPATFFVITGDNKEYHPLMARMVQEGHCVALHGESHNYRKIYAGADAFFADLQAASDAVYAACGIRPTLFRFPGGSSNSICGKGGMKTLITRAGDMGYTYVDWNVSAEDATGAHYSAQEIARRVIGACRGRREAVVLMHDTAKNASTRDALPAIVEALRAEGCTFGTVDMLAAPVQHIKPAVAPTD